MRTKIFFTIKLTTLLKIEVFSSPYYFLYDFFPPFYGTWNVRAER